MPKIKQHELDHRMYVDLALCLNLKILLMQPIKLAWFYFFLNLVGHFMIL